MNEIFGVQTSSILVVLVALFVVCLALVGAIAIRQPVLFKIGIRNIPRRPSQTILIVLGLMLSTLIISAAFTIGDTLNHSIRVVVLDTIGEIDEGIVLSTGEEESTRTGGVMPEQLLMDLRMQLSDDPDIDGLMGILVESTPMVHPGTQLSEPSLTLSGLDPEGLADFGGLTSVDGEPVNLQALPADSIVLGEAAAEELDARQGDIVIIFVRNQPIERRVAAIAPNSLLTGYYEAGEAGGYAMRLEDAQELLRYPDQITYIAVSNRGGVTSGVDLTDQVISTLDSALAGKPYAAQAFKRDSLDEAEVAGNQFLSIFLIFGLFSIAVGILLIFLIFTMLAAERQPEMGVARAVGMKRRHLIESFLAEGMAYDLVSAVVGAVLGIVVAFVMATVLARMFANVLDIHPAVSWRSLVIAYTLGVIVTFITVVISSWRVSRLNIVRAVRNIPEPHYQRAGRRWLLYGIAGIVFEVLLVWLGASSGQAFPFTLGVSMLPFSLAAVLRRFGVSARLVYTTAALLVLIYWLLPDAAARRIFPETSGGIEMFFVSGIMLVSSATIAIVWNADLITGAVGKLGRSVGRWLPAVKTAIAYPLANRGRTGMTIAMFSLIIFSLVMMAAINANILALLTGENAGAGWDVVASQPPTNPLPGFNQALEEQGTDTSMIAASAAVLNVPLTSAQVRIVGDTDWGNYSINGATPDFIELSDAPLQTIADGYVDDQSVWDAVSMNSNLAVIDSFSLPTAGLNAGGEAPFQLRGVDQDDETMVPIAIQIRDPATGRTRQIEIIGIIDAEVSILSGIFLRNQTLLDLFGQPDSITYFVRLQPGTDDEQAANVIEAALITYGIQADSIDAIIDEAVSQSRSFLLLFQGFMGLGLVVGIAALGVIAFRSVVERRQQIGMLRAIGYRRGMVAASFMIESLIVTVLGVLSGTLLGIALARNLMASDYFLGGSSGVGFITPWGTILIFTAVSLGAALVMAFIPARRAASVPVAEALRYE